MRPRRLRPAGANRRDDRCRRRAVHPLRSAVALQRLRRALQPHAKLRTRRPALHQRPLRVAAADPSPGRPRVRRRRRGLSDKVLYFPHIRVPDNAWFTRALLYWDEVGTIVPNVPPDELKAFMGEHTMRLMNAGLVSPLKANRALLVPRFDDAFIELLEADPDIGRTTTGPRKTFSLHTTKPGHLISAYLRERGLVYERPGSPWLEVDERIADLLMTFLACTLGAVDGIGMTPITDRAESLAVLTGSTPAAPAATVNRLELTVLEALLPAPADGVSAHELARFKDQHGDELRLFRREIETFATDATLLEPSLRERRAELFRDKLTDQVADIGDRMKRRWPRIVFGTLCGVAAAAIPVAGAAAGGAALAAAGGLPGLAAAVYSAFDGGKSDWRGNSVAYAALAQERFGGR